jgi:hypothetical protein
LECKLERLAQAGGVAVFLCVPVVSFVVNAIRPKADATML